MNKKITTLKDIAKALQIAPSTVSKALRESSDLSEEMIAKVKKAASKMNYSPNYMAQRLRDRRTKVIAVIVPNLQDSYYTSIIDGMEDLAFRKGYNLMIHKSNESFQREQVLLDSLVTHVDGILLCLSAETKKFDHLRQLKQKNIPLVLFERYTEKVKCSKVVFNDEKTSYAITECLIKNGCGRIAYISGPQEIDTFLNRLNGYKQALDAHKIAYDEKLIYPTKLSKQEGRQAFNSLMHSQLKPDAIITDTGSILMTLYQEQRKIFSNDDQLRLATFDANPFYSQLQGPIICVSGKGYEMGSHAFQICINEIEADEKVKMTKEIISSELIVRMPNPQEPSSVVKMNQEYEYAVKEEVIYVY